MIEKIVELIAENMKEDKDSLYGKSHESSICTAKYISWYYLHIRCGISIMSLVRHFGRSRRVVYYGINKIKGWLKYDSDFSEKYNVLECELEERLKKD